MSGTFISKVTHKDLRTSPAQLSRHETIGPSRTVTSCIQFLANISDRDFLELLAAAVLCPSSPHTVEVPSFLLYDHARVQMFKRAMTS